MSDNKPKPVDACDVLAAGGRLEPKGKPIGGQQHRARNVVPLHPPANDDYEPGSDCPDDSAEPSPFDGDHFADDGADASQSAKPPRGARVEIQVTEELHDVIDQAIKALSADSSLFQQLARLARAIEVAEHGADGNGAVRAGTPQIHEVPIANLRDRLTRVARFLTYDRRTKEWRDTHPSDAVVQGVQARGEWPGIRALVGITSAPSMRPDGTVFDAPGYDATTGYLYSPRCVYPSVPTSPTHEDAQRALKDLLVPWAEFPVATAAERYVGVAAHMTLVARPAIQGACPAFVADAPTRGSGKSLYARMIGVLAHGREPALMTFPSKLDELEKILGGYALRGASLIVFDNLSVPFGGGPLDKVLTCADHVELRVLGKSEIPSHPWRAVMVSTGNNVVITGDTPRRALVCRLDPMMERPEERTGYAISDLPAWCMANHPRLVCAALTLLRAYTLAGRPKQGLKGWGSFEAWVDLIGSAIVWAGGEDVTACRPTIAGNDDPETAALRTLLTQLPKLKRDGATISYMLRELFSEKRMSGGYAEVDGFDGLREALAAIAPPKHGALPDAQKLGFALKRMRGRIVDNAFLDNETDSDTNVNKWFVRRATQQA